MRFSLAILFAALLSVTSVAYAQTSAETMNADQKKQLEQRKDREAKFLEWQKKAERKPNPGTHPSAKKIEKMAERVERERETVREHKVAE